MKRDDVKTITDQAIQDLRQELQAGHSDTLKRFLNMMGRFHNYSWHNCLLIAVQMPDASFIAGFHRWLQLGRHVRKGEKGIGILAPLAYRNTPDADEVGDEREKFIRGFKVVHVFDVSQTEGEELPQIGAIHGDPGQLMSQLENLIRDSGIKITNTALPRGTEGVSLKGEIQITEGLSPAERFAVLAHELAHERLHGDPDSRPEAKTVRETEAEAVAYVVCRAFGLDCSTRSSDYIQLYQGSEATLAESLGRIQHTAARIIRSLDSTHTDAEEGTRHAA
ncbi:MAG: ArdC-like ssDNA-binding domain-containing protein [Thermoguttaceae bacterium]